MSVSVMIAVVLLLAACGGGKDAQTRKEPGSSPRVLHAAVKETTDAGSAAFTLDMSTKGQVAGQSMDMTAHVTGVYDFETGDMEMDMATTLPGQGEMDIQVRAVEGILYMRYPDSLAAQMGLPPGAAWIKMDPATLTGLSAEQMESMSGQIQDPTQLLAFLEAAGADVEEAGTEEIDGFETTVYKATATLGALMEEQSEAVEKVLGKGTVTEETLETMADVEIPMEVWVDGDGRVRRLRVQMDMSAAMAGASGQEGGAGSLLVDLEENFTDFGVDVEVEPPPATETVDFAELFANLGQGN
ncbi:MAG: hypothetical protein IT198_14870 [Acidimicrobiia bacterium]|nr:hypothetical protein [Acidimicrobiia bacterium]